MERETPLSPARDNIGQQHREALIACAMHAVPMKKLPDRSAAIASALRTIATEQAGVAALAEALNNGLSESFARAIEMVSAIRGRVIITGVGKSGHIGAKIAATLASTGTPAFFVHPAEATHGDLGMIAKDDAIIAMSWSGESAELKSIVAYSRRFSIPLVAITSGETSALAREADVVLLLPRVPEACPHGLAPTTSTLLQLIVGDALAIALLEAREFTPDQFRTFHPGGQLGASLMKVREIMHGGDSVPVAVVGSALRDAMVVLSKKRFGCVCVVDGEGRLAGIVTDGDLARNLDRNLAGLTVDEIMTRTPKTVDPDMLTGEAVAVLDEKRISALVVVEDGKPVGIVHFHDLLRIGVV
jgi:arabinose-5-phosphate isomerase